MIWGRGVRVIFKTPQSHIFNQSNSCYTDFFLSCLLFSLLLKCINKYTDLPLVSFASKHNLPITFIWCLCRPWLLQWTSQGTDALSKNLQKKKFTYTKISGNLHLPSNLGPSVVRDRITILPSCSLFSSRTDDKLRRTWFCIKSWAASVVNSLILVYWYSPQVLCSESSFHFVPCLALSFPLSLFFGF